MMPFKRATRIAFLSLIASVTMASAAQAAYYAYPRVTNQTTSTVIISNLKWSGSYNPRIESSILPGQTSSGQLKTVLELGWGGMNFDAVVVDADGQPTEKRCHFTFNIRNNTGDIAGVGHIPYGGAQCDSIVVGQSIYFTIY